MSKLHLVTGAAGHLGQAVITKLKQQGERVRALVLPHEKNKLKDIEIIEGNILDKSSLLPFFNFKNKDVSLIHCAGVVSISKHDKDIMNQVNIRGTKNLLDLSLKNEIGNFIYVSSVHAITEAPTIYEPKLLDPSLVVGDYAKTKAAASNLVIGARGMGLNTNIVFPSGMIGPYDLGNGHLTQMVVDFYKGKLPIAIRGGYDFVDVRDVAKAIVTISNSNIKNESFILSNRYYTIKEMLNLLYDITKQKKTKIYLPISLVRLVTPIIELYSRVKDKNPLFTSYSLYTLQSNSIFSHSKAYDILGYRTRSMEETLRDTINYLKKFNIV